MLFADTNSLADAAITLLQDDHLRHFMEQNAVKYIYDDHFSKYIVSSDGRKQLSSIANLSMAVTNLARENYTIPRICLM